jgi:transcriptional regulator with XRE-family HTH domain/tetratricopeptide (TPR) repeat protein
MPRRRKPEKPTPRGGALRYLRTARGVPEKELARREGVSPSVITELEHGVRELTRERFDELLAHLEVPPEAAEAALLARELIELPPPPASPVDPTEEEYRALHRAAIHAAGVTLEAIRSDLVRLIRERRMELDRRQAGELWEEVKVLKPAGRRRTVLEEARFWTWAFAERLCEESRRMAAHSADRALELAELAVEVAQRAAVPERWRPFLVGYCWGFIGNARRVKGNLPFADEAFCRAEELWQAGAPEGWPLDGGRLLDLKASLRRHQGRFSESLALLNAVLMLPISSEDKARILLKKAFTYEQGGQWEKAVDTLKESEDLSADSGDLDLLFGIRFNLAVNFCHLDQYAQAAELIEEVRKAAVLLRRDLHLVRVLWLQGRADAGIGRKEQALTALEQVRKEFAVRQIAYDAALVSLEVAALRLEKDQTVAVRALAESMAWIFEAQGLHVHALAALDLFCRAAAREKATVELARRVHRFLERSRYNPQLRFDEDE